MAASAFSRALETVLAHEGGYVDHPSDPGGATNMGITRRTLADWRGVSPYADLPKAEVRALARSEAEAIYRARYWDLCRCEEMPAGLDLALFDFAVNSGPFRAVSTLQALVGVARDGIVGPVTLAAVAQRTPKALIEALCRERLGFLERLATFATFGRGWTQRVAAVRAAALAMASSSSTSETKDMTLLQGYKTYIVGALMLVIGALNLAGIDVPGFSGAAGMELIAEGFAIIFLRKGIKAATSRM